MIGPRWWFFGAHPKTGAVTMLAEATPKLGESHARVLGHLLADDTKMRLQIHSPKGKAPLANPALRLPAGDHVAYPRWTVYEPAAGYLVATLSGLLSAAQAKKAAKNLATWLGFPVAVVEEFHGGKSNPGTPDPVRGERWARRGGGSAAEVVEVKRPKVHIKAGGKHDWPIIQDFKADYRPPAGRLPNPKRRNPNTMTLTKHESAEFSRAAQSMYARGQNDLGHLLSMTAAVLTVPQSQYDRAADAYRAWLVFDEPKPNPSRTLRAKFIRQTRRLAPRGVPGSGSRRTARALAAGREAKAHHHQLSSMDRGLFRGNPRTPMDQRTLAATLLDQTLGPATEATQKRGPYGPALLKARNDVAAWLDGRRKRFPTKAIYVLTAAANEFHYRSPQSNPKGRIGRRLSKAQALTIARNTFGPDALVDKRGQRFAVYAGRTSVQGVWNILGVGRSWDEALEDANRPAGMPHQIMHNPRVRAEDLKVGDIVMPPARELRLWMKRHGAEKGMRPDELGIMLVDIHEGQPDKLGRWIWFVGYLRDQFYTGGKQHEFRFKARPDTPWTLVASPQANPKGRKAAPRKETFRETEARFEDWISRAAENWASIANRRSMSGIFGRLYLYVRPSTATQDGALYWLTEDEKPDPLWQLATAEGFGSNLTQAQVRAKVWDVARRLPLYAYGSVSNPRALLPCGKRRHNPGCPCDPRCCGATGNICECRCGGAYHKSGGGGNLHLTHRNPRGGKIAVGDWVQYRAAFLRSTGMYTGDVPRAKGIVTALTPFGGAGNALATIEWDIPGIPERVLTPNLKRVGDYEPNPSYRLSGTVEEIPDAAPVVRRRGPGRPRKVRVAPVELAAELDPIPFEVPAEAPGRELQAGDRVTVPYSGRASYFGRAVKHTRESGIFEGYTYENDQRLAFVRVTRGHTVETHAFPVEQVRLHGKSFAAQAAGRQAGRPAKLARLTWKAHGSLAKAEAMLEKASAEHAATEALAMELYPQHEAQPGRPRGRTEAASRDYLNARAKLRRLTERVELLDSVVRSLGGGGPVALGYGEATGTDPWATNRRRYSNPSRPNHGAFDGPRTVRGAKRKRNPRGSERERAVRTFKLWHEFAPHRITRIKGPDRLIPRTLVKLGDIRAIDYISNKYGGRAVTYTHKTDRPRPVLATDPDGQHLHIVGGKVKITADGLIH